MTLFEMLDNYKTTPQNEMRKIWNILHEKYGPFELWDALGDTFKISEFRSYESSLNKFYEMIMNSDELDEYDDFDKKIMQYRMFTELLVNLLSLGLPNYRYGEFDKNIEQLYMIITDGLRRCGYEMKNTKGKYVTSKIDVVSETIAAENSTYSTDIFDFLIAKTVVDKERALTSLSIKLEAEKPFDSYTKNSRDYVQLLRHKKERVEMQQYAWFFEKSNYNDNLDKLFSILICYVSHINNKEIIKEFDNNCGHKKEG